MDIPFDIMRFLLFILLSGIGTGNAVLKQENGLMR